MLRLINIIIRISLVLFKHGLKIYVLVTCYSLFKGKFTASVLRKLSLMTDFKERGRDAV